MSECVNCYGSCTLADRLDECSQYEESGDRRHLTAYVEELERRATQLAYSYDNDYTDGEAQATRRIARELRALLERAA